VIDQSLSLEQLSAGMARCVREWILPALTEPWPRLQAEQLAALLEALPHAFGARSCAHLRGDNDAARAALERYAVAVPAPPSTADLDALVAYNRELKTALVALARALHARGDAQSAERLREVQALFLDSLRREQAAAAPGDDWEHLTARDRAAAGSEAHEG
jgi:hypothetical protein